MLPREGLSSPLTASENQGDRLLPDQLLMWACVGVHSVLSSVLAPFIVCSLVSTVKLVLLEAHPKADIPPSSQKCKGQVIKFTGHTQASLTSSFCPENKKSILLGLQWATASPGISFLLSTHARERFLCPHYRGKKEQRRGCASSERKFID